MIPHTDILLRILVLIMSVETAARYALWYGKVLRERPPEPLRELMMAICVAHGWIAFRTITAVIQHVLEGIPTTGPFPQPHDGMAYIASTFLCLIPCWRISCQASTAQITANVVIRLGLAYSGAVVLGILLL